MLEEDEVLPSSVSFIDATLHHFWELMSWTFLTCLMLPGAASGITVELADTSGLYCLLKFNFKGLFCLSFYLFKKWKFVKLKLYIKSCFKIHLCICFKIIKSIMDLFYLFIYLSFLPFFILVRGFSSTQGIFQLFTSLKKNFKKLQLDG